MHFVAGKSPVVKNKSKILEFIVTSFSGNRPVVAVGVAEEEDFF